MSNHTAKTPVTNPEDCLFLVTRFAPQERISDEEEPYHKAAQWDYEQGFGKAIAAAKAAGEYMEFARYFNHRSAIDSAERVYAQLVLATVNLQNKMEEWGAPTMWTDGEVDNEGYVAIWNAGREEIDAWQGGEVDYIKVDQNGLGMRNA